MTANELVFLCFCCNRSRQLITSLYCEECSNQIIDYGFDEFGKKMADLVDYVKNIKQGE